MKKSDTISKIQTYAIVHSTMNELEKIADSIQAMRDDLYKFLDEHYDFSNKELVARLKKVSLIMK